MIHSDLSDEVMSARSGSIVVLRDRVRSGFIENDLKEMLGSKAATIVVAAPSGRVFQPIFGSWMMLPFSSSQTIGQM